MSMIIRCKLCSTRGLHLLTNPETNETTARQCINCGYTTNEKLKGKKKDNEWWNQMSDFIKKYSKESEEYIWIPSLMTLPHGSIFPQEVKNKLKWMVVDMVDIPEEERKDYPIEGQEDKFHTKKLDTDNGQFFDSYLEAFAIFTKKIESIEGNNG